MEVTPTPVPVSEPEPTPAPAAAIPSVPAGDPAGGGPSVPQVPPPKWATQRIDTLTGKLRDTEREKGQIAQERDLLKAHLEALGKAGAQPGVPGDPPVVVTTQPPGPAPKSEAQIRIETEAALRFESAANEVMAKGRSEFKDFDTTLQNFNALGPVDPKVVEAAFDTGAGHRVLYLLAQDLNEAQRIMALTPTKMAIEMDRLATKAAPPPLGQVSKAPAPITPLAARSASATDELRDEDDTATWMQKREAQLAQKRKRA